MKKSTLHIAQTTRIIHVEMRASKVRSVRRVATLLTMGLLVFALTAIEAHAQLPVRTRQVQLLSNNNVNFVRLQAPDGMAADWTLLPPITVGATGSLPYSTVAGANAQLNWLAPSTDGYVLTMVGGLPGWTPGGGNAWLLTGNSNATGADFLGPTTASIPLNFATANAVPGSQNWYLGTVAAGNLRMSLSTAGGFAIGNATNAVNTVVTGTFGSTGTTALASAASSNATILNAVTPGALTVNGTALTPNVTLSSLGGVAKITIPVGYDRIVLANATGSLDEASLSTVVGGTAWLLTGNPGAIATNFVGPTTASIPLNFATANAIAGSQNWYLGTVAAANLRMSLSTGSGFEIGNATNAVNTFITGTLTTTGTTQLAGGAGSNVTLLGAGVPGTVLINGTALTPNVTMTSLGGVAKPAIPVGYDRIVLANAVGSLDEASLSTVIGGTAWLLAGNANAIATSFVGTTAAGIPLNFATANAVPGTQNWYLGTVAAGNLRMSLSLASGFAIGNATNAVNTLVTGTFGSTGTTALASAASSNATILNAVTPGTLVVNGTALTPNVTLSSLGGVAKVAIPVGYDRIVLANASGSLDEASLATVIGGTGWLLAGNANAIATNFVGPTTASIPLNFATANAVPGSQNWYLGTVAAGNLRMSLSTAGGFAIGNATNAVNTLVTGTFGSTGTTTLASAASSNAIILNAATPGTLTVNGTALTPNVTISSLGGVAKASIPLGYDRVLLGNNVGSIDEVSVTVLLGGAGIFEEVSGVSNIRRRTAYVQGGIVGTPGTGAIDLQGNRSAVSQTATGNYSSIGGGRDNTAGATGSTVGGGNSNSIGANDNYAVIAGGDDNDISSSSARSFIGGGGSNVMTGSDYTAIVSGLSNSSSSSLRSFVGSGWSNDILNSSNSAAIVSGQDNSLTLSTHSFIGAGIDNTMSNGNYGFIGSGNTNTITSTTNGIIVGGSDNVVTTSANYSSIVGGQDNTINSSTNAFIAGGADNSILVGGNHSAIWGGRNLTLTGSRSAGFNAGTLGMTISASDVIAFGSTNLWLANNTNVASQIRFYEAQAGAGAFPAAATNYTAFQAGAQTADITYTLPTSAPLVNGSVLSSTIAGVMSWTDVGGTAWLLAGNAGAIATNFVGPTTASIPLNFATANAVPGSQNWYLGTVAAGNLRMVLSTAGGFAIGNATNAVNTVVTGTFGSTGTTALATAASSNATILNAVTPGTLTVNGTALTPNVTLASLGGVAKVAIPVGYDRIVLANATGSLDEASLSTVLGGTAWLLAGNPTAIATNFVGPTTASIPLNFATANAVPGSQNWYLGTVAAGNLRMVLSTAGGFAIGNATNAVNTVVTGTFGSTGTTALATAASSNTTILNAVTPGTLTVNGTALTPNVTLASLGGVAKAAVPGGYDRFVLANNAGSLDQASFAAILGSAGWALAGNATASAWNGAAGNFLGTTSTQPLTIATTNATAQDIYFYSGANGATKRMEIDGATGYVGIGNITPAASMDVDGAVVMRPAAVAVTANNQIVTPSNRSYIVLDPGAAGRTGLILANGLQAGQILILRILETATQSVTMPDAAGSNVDLTGDWVGAANDIISLIWTGTDWVETSRSNN